MSHITNDWYGLIFCTYLIPDLLCGVHDVSKERVDCCIGHQDVNGPTPIQSLHQTQSKALVHAITQWSQQVEETLIDTCTSSLNAVRVTKAAAGVNHALHKRWTVCFHETLTKSCQRASTLFSNHNQIHCLKLKAFYFCSRRHPQKQVSNTISSKVRH